MLGNAVCVDHRVDVAGVGVGAWSSARSARLKHSLSLVEKEPARNAVNLSKGGGNIASRVFDSIDDSFNTRNASHKVEVCAS